MSMIKLEEKIGGLRYSKEFSLRFRGEEVKKSECFIEF